MRRRPCEPEDGALRGPKAFDAGTCGRPAAAPLWAVGAHPRVKHGSASSPPTGAARRAWAAAWEQEGLGEQASWARRLAARKQPRGVLHGLNDFYVARATTDIAAERGADLGLSG